jgi:hypothetical protein
MTITAVDVAELVEDTPDEIDGDVIFGHVPMADLRLARSELQKLYSPSTGGD